MKQEMRKGIMMAILAAVLYAVSSPFSKILLNEMPPTLMAGFLYLGAGVGMSLIAVSRRVRQVENTEIHLSKAEMPYTVAMILLDIAAPICMLIGLNATTAANASLLNNFEIVATALIALVVFKERISKRLWTGILFVTLSSVILSFEDVTSLEFSYGSLFVLLAAVFWGLENNCTRKLSSCDPLEIVLLKGIFSGIGSIVIGLVIGERLVNLWSVIAVMAVGIVSYGLSIYFYVHAQRLLGAARTSAYYAVSPFIAAFLSILIFGQIPEVTYFIALILMAVGAWYSSHDGIEE
jgi:membrane protein